MTAALVPVPVEDVDAHWPYARRWIDVLVRRNRAMMTADEAYQKLKAKKLQMWLVVNGSVRAVYLTEVYDHPAGKTVGLPIVGGDLEAGLPHLETILEWARENGCVRAAGVGRRGWARALKQLGWRERATIVDMRL